jgi:hypothetical protein
MPTVDPETVKLAPSATRALVVMLLAVACAPSPPPPVAPAAVSASPPAASGIDESRAAEFFAEAAELCASEAGRHWGISLCGPMVIADPVTRTIATNQPAPSAPRPTVLGYANAALDWGGTRWTTLVWQHLIGADEPGRRILLIHELFHRIQPQLGLMLPEPRNDHLDTVEGRFWLQLEWRALGRALGASGAERLAALGDALAFRAARHRRFPEAAENERILEINEGLPQYTGTVTAFPSAAAAAASVVRQLERSAEHGSFVRTFAYGSGAAYGVLLDTASPGWSRGLEPSDELAGLLSAAMRIAPAADAEAAALRYDGAALRVSESKREAERQALVADYRRRFVDGPLLILTRGRIASFATDGMTPIPGAGTIYPTYRTTAEWGSLSADRALLAEAGATVVVPAPAGTEGRSLRGDGWTLELADGWMVRAGSRPGDFEVVRESTEQ